MSTIILILTATLIFGSHIIYLWHKRHVCVEMLPVEAGPVEGTCNDFTVMESVRMGVAAKELNPELQHFVVHNECMVSRGIMPGDVIGVRMFSEDFTLSKTTPDDVMLIYLNDARFRGHKIRVRGEQDEANQVCHTYYYQGNRKVMSAHPHAERTIKGVVEDVYHIQ